jgi:hypothetical protein
VEDHLRASGYQNAPITAWFGDFAWIIPYYRAVVSGDQDAKRMLQETHVSSAVGQLAAHARGTRSPRASRSRTWTRSCSAG